MHSTLFNQFLIKLKNHLPETEIIPGKLPDAAITIPGKHPATGNLKVWDDDVELTISIGEYYHCHYDPAVFSFGELSQDDQEELCIDSAIAFISDFLSDKAVLYVRFSGNRLCESGVVNHNNIESLPVDAKRFVWSGPPA